MCIFPDAAKYHHHGMMSSLGIGGIRFSNIDQKNNHITHQSWVNSIT